MKYILIHPDDNVAVALQPLQKGEDITCGGHEIGILEDIPAGHKVAVKTIRQGENVIKYGFPIGHVTQEAMPGQWINEHVLKTNLQGITDYRYQPVAIPGTDAGKPRTFKGYVRKNGDVGIRNELWIIPTVGCVNGVAQELARRKGTTPARIALAWLLHQKPWIVPIPGTKKVERLIENAGAGDVVLTPEELAAFRSRFETLPMKGERYDASQMRLIDK